MLAADQRLTVVFNRDGLVRPTELGEQIGDGCAVFDGDGVVVDDDRDDAQRDYFFAAASLAAAFFSALPARTLMRLSSSTMSATERNVLGSP